MFDLASAFFLREWSFHTAPSAALASLGLGSGLYASGIFLPIFSFTLSEDSNIDMPVSSPKSPQHHL